jgi:hypothetical protein
MMRSVGHALLPIHAQSGTFCIECKHTNDKD